ncbi:hypothetical protein ACRWCU_24555 [Escherichia coli]
MSVLLTEPTQQANDKVFKTAHVAFSVVTGTGRYVTGLKQFRDANPELCTEVSDQNEPPRESWRLNFLRKR